jgi:hypothetical protein
MEVIMENKFQEEERYFRAKERVGEIKGFYGHLSSYVLVCLGLLTLNLWTSPNHLWFYWPLLGWGIGVIIHGVKVFNFMPFIGQDWEARKIKEFMEEEQEARKQNNYK